MYLYSATIEEMTTNANIVKESLLAALDREGLLKKSAEELAKEYAIILHKKSWLGRAWDSLFDNLAKGTDIRVDVVRRIS